LNYRKIFEVFDGKFLNKVDELVLAKRIVENCIKLHISTIKFNQGAWYFGSNEVKKGIYSGNTRIIYSKVKLNLPNIYVRRIDKTS